MAEKTDLNKVVDKVLVSEEELQRRIAELGAQLSEDYEGKDVICVCILRGAVHFFSDLVRHMTCMTELDFMSISSYGNGKRTSGIVRIAKDMDTSITGRHVLIIEDIMDSGHTLKHLKKVLEAREPASLKICCLLDKPSAENAISHRTIPASSYPTNSCWATGWTSTTSTATCPTWEFSSRNITNNKKLRKFIIC